MLQLTDYDYILDPSKIAQTPATPPSSAKCLMRNADTSKYHDLHVSDIPGLLDPETLLIYNTSKVVKARIPLTHATRTTLLGTTSPIQQGEIFFLAQIDIYTFSALVRPGKKFRIGDTISQDHRTCTVQQQTEEGRIFVCNIPVLELLEQYGMMPLPPYIAYQDTLADRYQPVLADQAGSVAAPTASLHFDREMLDEIQARGHHISTAILHIGLGTFQSVSSPDITLHDIHRESITIPTPLWTQIATHKVQKKPILAIGTTIMRTLESMPYIWRLLEKNDNIYTQLDHATITYRDELTHDIDLSLAQSYIYDIHLTSLGYTCETKIFLYPGQPYHIVDQLITNFHLPKSSLLMLVAAFMGYTKMMECYTHALEAEYRFFSFGDCMWIRG